MTNYIIIGLGNHGIKYKKTRHNAGFLAVDYIHKKNDFSKWEKSKKINAEISQGIIENQDITLIKPLTYMNNSGISVKSFLSSYELKTKSYRLIIIFDDLDLPFGSIRVREKGSSGGHKGLKSIIDELGTENFTRIRIGITNEWRQKKETDKFVLSKFSRDELHQLKTKILPEISDIVRGLITAP